MLDSFLQFTGVLAISVVVVGSILVGLVVFWAWRKWRQLKKFVASAAMAEPPMKVELDPVEPKDASWKKNREVQNLEKGMMSYELSPGNLFRIEDTEVDLQVWHAPDGQTCVVVYHNEGLGVWADIYLQYGTGSLTVSNAPTGGDLKRPEDRPAIFLKGASFAEIAERFFKEADSNRATVAITPGNFATVFETAYKEEMTWRASNGGVSEEEIRRVMESSDEENLIDEQFQEAVLQVKAQELEQYQESAIKNLSKSTSMPVAEWQKFEDSMFIVSDALHPAAFAEAMAETQEFPADTLEWLQNQARSGASCTEIFKALKLRVPAEIDCHHYGSVTEPLPAEVYAFSAVAEEVIAG